MFTRLRRGPFAPSTLFGIAGFTVASHNRTYQFVSSSQDRKVSCMGDQSLGIQSFFHLSFYVHILLVSNRMRTC